LLARKQTKDDWKYVKTAYGQATIEKKGASKDFLRLPSFL